MSDDVRLTQKRQGIALKTGLVGQLDKMQAQEASYYGGEEPYFRYNLYLLTVTDVQQGDLFVETSDNLEAVTDPKTGNPKQYRVIDDPEAFPDQHMEMIVDRMRGT